MMQKSRSIKLRTMLFLAVLLPVGSVLAACNTTAGLGQDVKNTGNAIKNTANDNKPSGS